VMGHLIVDCIFEHTRNIILQHNIKSVVVLDDFEQMAFGLESENLRANLLRRIKSEFQSLSTNTTKVYYSIGTVICNFLKILFFSFILIHFLC